MLSIQVTAQLGDLLPIQGRLEKATDPQYILDESAAFLLNKIRTRFLAEEGPEGKWVPSRSGQARRSAGGTGTLFDTGTLFRSIQLASAGTNARAIQTDVPYAGKHNFGEDGQVKRLFMAFNDNDVEILRRILYIRVKEILNG